VIVAALLAPGLPGVVRATRQPARPAPQIRLAAANDGERLTALPVAGLDWAALLDDPAAAVLSLQADERVIGVAAESRGEVLAVYVASPWRRRYWGSVLVDALTAQLQARGDRSVQVPVPAGDRLGTAFGAGQGWQPAVQVFARVLGPSAGPGWRGLLRRLRVRR
jgi:GNAT superfamily N-acetyltransferase